MTTTLTLLAALFVGFAPASDQDADAAAYAGSSGDTSYYAFDDDDIDGEVLSADGANLTARVDPTHASLIRLRPHFIPELTRMALDAPDISFP